MKLFILNTNILDIDEINYDDKYIFTKDKLLNFGSKILKQYLIKYLNLKECQLCKNIHGKPFFKSKDKVINFNISHDSNYVMLFFNEFNCVGIDILSNSVRTNEFIKNFKNVLTNTELEHLKTENGKSDIFNKIWNFKESYLKFKGTGINLEYLKKICYFDKIIIDNSILIDSDKIKIVNNYYYKNTQLIELKYNMININLCFKKINENKKVLNIIELKKKDINNYLY